MILAKLKLFLDNFLHKIFSNNYRNPLIKGFLREVLWNSPAIYPKWKIVSEISITI